MMSVESFKEYCKEKSYAQLINERDKIIEEINAYESMVKNGFDSDANRYYNTEFNYEKNMEYLAVVLEEMRAKYESKMLMVDEDNEEEQLNFIRNVIWVVDDQAEGYRKKLDEAARLLYKLMKRGNADALNIRGAMYYEGRQVKQNYTRAIHWYIKAAGVGSSLAMSNLAYAYFYGKGVEVDVQEAYKYASVAAQYGEWDAYNLLGDMYQKGTYVPKDLDQAIRLYTLCLDSVNNDESTDAYPMALAGFAECIFGRIGGMKDIESALLISNKAKEIAEKQVESGDFYAPSILERINKDLEMIQEEIDMLKKKKPKKEYEIWD